MEEGTPSILKKLTCVGVIHHAVGRTSHHQVCSVLQPGKEYGSNYYHLQTEHEELSHLEDIWVGY